MTSNFTYTSDFHQEFEAETATLLRSRFLWFAGIAAALTLIQFGVWLPLLLKSSLNRDTEQAAALMAPEGPATPAVAGPVPAVPPIQRSELTNAAITVEPDDPNRPRVRTSMPDLANASIKEQIRVGAVHDVVTALVYIGIFFYVRSTRPRKHVLLRLSFLCIILDGTLDVAAESISGTPGAAIMRTVVAHSLAAALLPWSPRQAVFPMIPLIILNALSWTIFARFSGPGLVGILFTPLAAAPGIVIAYAKFTRRTQSFKLRFLQSRYGMIRRELVDARRIHESLFPHPLRSGALRFDYRYEPMLQIGGDYLYAKFSPPQGGEPPAFNMILIDVTGHGIAAALTVNRLYGEVERLFAEDPQTRPGEILRALNRYVYLTLANHSVFVTALCVRIEMGRNQLEYASGGHPPAFLRAVDGTLDELHSTSFVLGACADSDFDPTPETRQFGPGDTLVAYTDGAIEARNEAGRVLGIKAIQRILASGKPDPAGVAIGVGGWITTILSAVDNHRLGPPADDTIVVEITRPIPSDTEPRRRSEIRAATTVAATDSAPAPLTPAP